MIKKNNNEQGYALVSVLLVIIVFSIVFLSFIGQAFSSTKQNQHVEDKSKSLAAAEMGISFYSVVIQDTFETNQPIVESAVKDIMEGPDSASKNYKRVAAEEMAEKIEEVVPTIATPPNALFEISNFVATVDPVNQNSHVIEISFDVTGLVEGKKTKLYADMTIDLGEIDDDGSSESTSTYNPPSLNTVSIPDPACTSFESKKGPKKDTGCNEILVSQYVSPKNGGNGLSGKTIYSTGTVELSGNANHSIRLIVHAEGPVTVDKNMNNTSTFFLETKSDATFEGQISLNISSGLYIAGNLINLTGHQSDNGNHFTLSNSTVYVGKSASLNKVSIDKKSLMCVEGNLTAYSINADKENLYVMGDVTIHGVPSTKYKVDKKTFFTKCGTYIPGEFNITWDENIDTNLENVDY
jgi:hypothetical protein